MKTPLLAASVAVVLLTGTSAFATKPASQGTVRQEVRPVQSHSAPLLEGARAKVKEAHSAPIARTAAPVGGNHLALRLAPTKGFTSKFLGYQWGSTEWDDGGRSTVKSLKIGSFEKTWNKYKSARTLVPVQRYQSPPEAQTQAAFTVSEGKNPLTGTAGTKVTDNRPVVIFPRSNSSRFAGRTVATSRFSDRASTSRDGVESRDTSASEVDGDAFADVHAQSRGNQPTNYAENAAGGLPRIWVPVVKSLSEIPPSETKPRTK
jgi:hypothetical protein